jgi:WD40 repeat protein
MRNKLPRPTRFFVLAALSAVLGSATFHFAPKSLAGKATAGQPGASDKKSSDASKDVSPLLAAGMETIVKVHGGAWLNYVSYSPDQKEFSRVWAFGDLISDTESWKKHRDFDVGIRMVAYSPDGKTMATAEGRDGARIWNVAERGEPVPTLSALGQMNKLTKSKQVLLTPAQARNQQQVLWTAYSADGSRLLTALSNGHVKIWKTDSGAELADLALTTAPILCACFHPDGKRVAGGDGKGVLHVCDLELNKAISVKPTQLGGIAWVAYSPDATRLVTAHQPQVGKGSVSIWNTADWSAQTEDGYWSAAFSKDGKQLALGGSDIRLLAAASLKEHRKIALSQLSMREASLMPEAAAAVKNPDAKLPVWIQSLAWRPDGRELAAGCFDGTVRLLRMDPSVPEKGKP